MIEKKTSDLLGAEGIHVGVGWGPHPIYGDDGFVHTILVALAGEWILCLSEGMGPFDKERARRLLGKKAYGRDFARYAARGIPRERDKSASRIPPLKGMFFDEVKAALKVPDTVWEWWDPGDKPEAE